MVEDLEKEVEAAFNRNMLSKADALFKELEHVGYISKINILYYHPFEQRFKVIKLQPYEGFNGL